MGEPSLLISVVIPTRDRAVYLRETLRTVLAIDDPEVEIVVSDNASEDDTKAVVASFTDQRLRYVNPGRRVSMRANFEFAFRQSNGQYLLYIGDDDGVMPRQFPALRWLLEQHRPDMLGWRHSTFFWPIKGFSDKRGGIRLSRASLFGQPRWVDTQPLAAALLECRTSALDPMPAVYHGCMSRAHLQRLQTPDGTVFAGRIPDAYVAYLSVLCGARFLHVEHPFTINGIGPASTGASHHRYRPTDQADSPARRFGTESAQDDHLEAIARHLPSIALNLFSTMETARRFSARADGPDYRAWYEYLMRSAAESDPELGSLILSEAGQYAGSTGTQPQLEQAQAGYNRLERIAHQKSLAARWRKVVMLSQSFKFGAGIAGRSTIATAIERVDPLVRDYLDVLRNKARPGLPWRTMMLRGIVQLLRSR